MIVEVKTKKYSITFNCDKVIDGSDSAVEPSNYKLMIMKKSSRDEFKLIAVFKEWECWQILDKELEKFSNDELDEEFILAQREQHRLGKKIETIQHLRFERHPEWRGQIPY